MLWAKRLTLCLFVIFTAIEIVFFAGDHVIRAGEYAIKYGLALYLYVSFIVLVV